MQKSIQDVVLNQIRKDNTQVTIFLINGFQIKGLIKAFDNYVVLIEGEGKQQMVYKHAISTVVPMKFLSNLNLSTVNE